MKHSLLPSILLVLGLAACERNSPVDGGCANPCDCCAAGEVCHEGACCQPDCAGKACGSDGCGGTCTGTCDPNYLCNPTTGACECEGEEDAAFCDARGVVCGTATGEDRCGRERIVSCDRCTRPETCNTTSGACECLGEEDEILCGQLGRTCGEAEVTDRCGTHRTARCGTCDIGQSCGVTGTCEVCVNEDDTAFCDRLEKACGPVTANDNCGDPRSIDCGGCDAGFACTAATNTCDPCTSETDKQFCALHGGHCGALTDVDSCYVLRTVDCGTCRSPDVCDASHTCQPCPQETDPVFCSRYGKACGPLTGTDNCGIPRAVQECGPCTSPVDVCDASGACVLCPPEADAQLCDFYFKNCGTPTLVDRCGTSRTPTCGVGTGACPGSQTCQPNSVCGNPGAPTNDTCSSPERLVFSPTGTLSGAGDTTNADDSFWGSCGGYGADVVYVFDLPVRKILTITATPGTQFGKPLIFLRRDCNIGIDTACALSNGPGQSVTTTTRALDAGSWYLIVDGHWGSPQGPFTFAIDAANAPPPPPNDACAGAQALAFTNGVALVTGGDTSAATGDYSDNCGSSTLLDGPDLVYKLTLTSPAAVVATVTRDATSPNYLPAVELLSSCPAAGGAPIECGTENNGVAGAGTPNLAPGIYYVVVDGAFSSYGLFSLEVKVLPPVTNDLCVDALDIPLAAAPGATDLVGSAHGDTSVATDNDTSLCNGWNTGRDLAYSFTIPAGAAKNVLVEVVPDANSLLEPNFFVKSDCAATTELACISPQGQHQPISTILRQLAPGTYVVIVDGFQTSTNGPFTINLTASVPPPPPGNDRCVRPTSVPLDPTTGTGQVSDTTFAATNDYSGGCGSIYNPHDGPDMVYSVVLGSTLDLAVRVTRGANARTYRPTVYIQSACGDIATELGCGLENNGAAATSATNLAPGTYYVIVDGIAGTAGDFTLDVVTYPHPTNDDCSNPMPMIFDSTGTFTARGDSCAMSADTNSSSNSSPCYGAGAGNDLVYQLVTTQTQDLELIFDAGHSSDAIVYVRTDCATPSSEVRCNNSYSGVSVLKLRNLPAQTYYVWIDNGYSCGVFSLTAHLTSPPPIQPNDLCATPQTVAIIAATGAGSASGNTDAATGDSDGSCRAGSGAELVYAFTLTAERTAEVRVIPQPGSLLQPVVYMRRSCSATTEMACQAVGWTNTAATLQFPRLAPATYYVFVDAWDREASGPFDLTITTIDPGPAAANDVCASAVPFPAFNPTTGMTSVTGNTLAGFDDDRSNCSTGAAPLTGSDLVYALTLATATRIDAVLTRGAGSPNYHPALSIRSSCSAADEVACAVETISAASIMSMSLAAGTWYFFVDGTDGSFGAFTLELQDRGAAIPGDDCGNALALNFSGGATTVTVSGDLNAGAANHGDPSCASGTGSDLVYALTTTADAFITATVTSTSTLRPIVSLRRTCDAPGPEIACDYSWSSGGSLSVASGRLPAGTYYVLVDSNGTSTTGNFDLTVTLASPANALATNDSCAAPTPLQFDAVTGAAHVAGDTRDGYDDYAGGCATIWTPLTGGDLVYSFNLPQAATVVAAVTRDASTPDYVPAIYLRRASCASALAADEVGCFTMSWGSVASLTVPHLPAGDYWVIVDGQKSTGGKFTLDVATIRGATNTTCATAMPLQLDANGRAEIAGDTSGSTNSSQGSPNCGSEGPELYYTFTTQAEKNVTVEIVPGNTNFAPAAYIRGSCSDPTTLKACDNNYGASALQVTARRLPADTYTVIVDTIYSAAAGPFILRLSAVDPPPAPAWDTCRQPRAVTLPASGAAALVISDSTLDSNDDYTSVCATAYEPLDGADVVYGFTLTAPAQVSARVTPKASSPRYRAAVYFRSACATVGNDQCAAALAPGMYNPVSARASLAAGDYYLIVDGVNGTAGEFDLELSQDTAAYVDGDHCVNAKSIDSLFVAGTAPTEVVATFTGDNTSAADDGDGSCSYNGIGRSGGDLFYRFTVARDSFVEVTLGASTGSVYAPQFYVRSSCTDPTTELSCKAASSGGGSITGSIYHMPAGTYFLVVDGAPSWQSMSGAFSARVSVRDSPPPPTNDTCTGATPLPLFPSGTGTRLSALLIHQDSRFARDDTQGTCASSAGLDVIYKFTVTATASFSATVTPDSLSPDFTPVIYLRTVCDQATDLFEVACAQAAGPGSAHPVTISANTLPPGTYYLYVDAYRASPADPAGGTFEINAWLDLPTAGPGNDGCAFAQTITLTGPAPSVTTLVNQSTANAVDDTTSLCASSAGAPSGPDIVYRLDIATESKVKLKVTPAGAFQPAVYLRRTCASRRDSNELACAAGTSAATPIEAVRSYVRPGSYFVWVDAGSSVAGNASGAFDLEVTLSTPTQIPPANDVCNATIPQITSGVAVTGTTVDAIDDYAGISGATCGSWPVPGPEVVYAYTPTSSGPISVQLTSNGPDLMLWVAEAVCGDTSACVMAVDNGGGWGGVDSWVYANGTAGVTYYLYVDSSQSGNAGTFTLLVN